MKFNGYILASDPNWIEESVKSYYSAVEKLYVSYDIDGLSWSGTDVSERTHEALTRLRKIDTENKIIEVSGSYSKYENPQLSELHQRREALNAASKGADWVFQIDTDEIVPNVGKIMSIIKGLSENIKAVYWPMRSFYNITKDGRFLEVCNRFGDSQAEYPGAIALRAGTTLDDMRHLYNPDQHIYIPLLKWPPRIWKGAALHHYVTPNNAILHISWVRSPEALKTKINAWGHSDQINPVEAYDNWANSPENWRSMRNFHPMYAHIWPRLKLTKLPYKASWN
jgi:hypothetical protein